MKTWDGDKWGTVLTVAVWLVVTGGSLWLAATVLSLLVH